MRGTNRKRALLLSSSVIILCLAVVVGMSWALFTDTQNVTNHLKAGDLKITLKRTELLKTTLNSAGYLFTPDQPDKTVVDFTNPTGDNVFDIGSTEKIVPGTKFSAKMQIENNSDVAFGYWIEIVCKDKTNGANLAKQLKVTVNAGNGSKSDFVGNGLTVKGANDGYVGSIEVGKADTFTVAVEFLDSDIASNRVTDNDLAKSEKIYFDLVVHAVQLTKAINP